MKVKAVEQMWELERNKNMPLLDDYINGLTCASQVVLLWRIWQDVITILDIFWWYPILAKQGIYPVYYLVSVFCPLQSFSSLLMLERTPDLDSYQVHNSLCISQFPGLIKFPWNIGFYFILFPNFLNRNSVLVDISS